MKTAAKRSSDRRLAGFGPPRTVARAGVVLALGWLLALAPAPDLPAGRASAAQSAPELKEFEIVLPDSFSVSRGQRTVRDGDTVLIRTYWDSGSPYQVHADFRQIDSNADSALIATRCADRVVQVSGQSETWSCYAFEHRISPDNTLEDRGNTPVPITAYDPATQLGTTTEAVRFCLCNHPLTHIETRVIGDSIRFIDRDGTWCYRVRNGDQITIHTTWARRGDLTLKTDFQNLDQFYLPGDDDQSKIEDSGGQATYEIRYRLSRTAWPQDDPRPKYPVPVLIEASDMQCGLGYVTVYFEMDITGPAGAPLFAPDLPAQAVTSTLPVAGTAPEDSRDVLLVVKHLDAANPDSTTRLVLALDANRRFAGEVLLVPGLNRLSLYGRDLVGNLSAATVGTVKYVAAAAISIPQPFQPGDAFVFDSPAGWSRSEVEIYNLAGDRIRAWTHQGAGGPLYEVSIPWDGRNGNGEAVRQGPYLLRYRMSDGAGRTALEEVKAFVLQK